MVVRLGIGATAAASIIFSILLVSNFLVFAASQDRQNLYSVSDAEDSLGDVAVALMGAGGTNILLETQAAIGSRPLDCETALAATASMVGDLSDSQQSGGVSVSSTARLAPDDSAGDNLSMLAPFDGSVSGELDLSVSMVAAGSALAGDVSISKAEVHLVHLPVELGRLAVDCTGALVGIVRTLSAEAPANCTSTEVDPLVLGASRSAASHVAADGFEFGLSYTIISSAECSVSLQVGVQQTGIVGPGGAFTVQLEAEGLASFAQPASAPPGEISQRTGP
jgi:hypothetical protein